MEKKRPFTLTAGIVNIVFAVIDLIFMVLVCTIVSQQAEYIGASYTAIIIMAVIEILFAGTIIILSSILLNKWAYSVEKFDKVTGLVIALFVFDCLAVISSLINIFGGNYVSILTLCIYAMCATFLMIDLCLNKRDLNRLNAQTPSQKSVPEPDRSSQNVVAPQERQKTVQPKVQVQPVQNQGVKTTSLASSELYQNLSDLKEMKDEKIITEEEYQKLKSKLIDKFEF